ncbi:ParB/Srx family N-terminal domain-containing protein [Paraburkholderia sp. BL10I2N1]|uniref:ParB/Srx family N-terminal domain-containing protein n=1 Tax=Paraburkholderia sp. BL10I2N1 TaxID=1938796 RepID=UPI001FB7AB7C|nr:ParB/Srx family N-terminal domain-containing protein [Paraburkholderia sp. BL10I2N1]
MPYSSLCPSPHNARTKPLSVIPALADNIRAKGLLQNLVVHEMKGSRGKARRHGVRAGQRRHAVLDLLYANGHITADYPVPVRHQHRAATRYDAILDAHARFVFRSCQQSAHRRSGDHCPVAQGCRRPQ